MCFAILRTIYVQKVGKLGTNEAMGTQYENIRRSDFIPLLSNSWNCIEFYSHFLDDNAASSGASVSQYF